MNFVRTLIILLSISFIGTSSSSIGSEFESSLSCSKFHFEEKVLEKLLRLELKMDTWEKSMTFKLDEINNIKTQTETFVQSIQDAQIRDQTRFNKSYQETVEHFKTQATNETDIYGDQMNALLESFSSKIEGFTEAENKRESVKKSMQLSFDKEQKRFNLSFDQIVENFKESSNKKLQEIIANIQTVVVTGCYGVGDIVPAGSLKFPDIKTSIGVSDLSLFKSTGKFTCQVPGYYYIAVTIMSLHSNLKIEIMRNSTAIHWQYVTTYYKDRSYWRSGAAVVALKLKYNDNVWIKQVSPKYIYQSCLTIFKIN
ncbi:Hypothetical predicted protein [Mytilus galloprovincialis]|uniref:C1q domain-containing protein n=1 Tax=Mytilus galloprovincialis TaxID=29158 RepID=A0A8B6FRE6_MYTGA|nr:Hypothetical predicted protein [Mytilus galloprovincialis]